MTIVGGRADNSARCLISTASIMPLKCRRTSLSLKPGRVRKSTKLDFMAGWNWARSCATVRQKAAGSPRLASPRLKKKKDPRRWSPVKIATRLEATADFPAPGSPLINKMFGVSSVQGAKRNDDVVVEEQCVFIYTYHL